MMLMTIDFADDRAAPQFSLSSALTMWLQFASLNSHWMIIK